jgi:membrane-associated protease RseP (regulator of RpoE activity)
MGLVGILLFALGIIVSVCLHEAGHMASAKSFGMKVSRYFVGFGPTLWSFRKGETEYGVKAIPLGGFVKIVGMTPQDDDVEPADQPRAMWRFPVWKRTIVMAAGSFTHFVLAFVVLWITFVFVGVPNPRLADPQPAYVNVEQCVVSGPVARACTNSDPVSPAKAAGLQNGDKIVKFNDQAVNNYDDLRNAIRHAPPGPASLTIDRNGSTTVVPVTLASVTRYVTDPATEAASASGKTENVSALGISAHFTIPLMVTYGPIDGIGQTGKATGAIFVGIFKSLGQMPGKIPNLLTSLVGGQRDENTPVSIVGASRVGGQFAEEGLWSNFLLLFVLLNLFFGVFNLLPLLPMDGGHIAISWFEKVRSWIAAWRGKSDPGRVDYVKLTPITLAVISVLGVLVLLTVAADIVNPIVVR